MDFTAICRLCLGNHDSINVLSYLDGKTKLLTVLDKITGLQVRHLFLVCFEFVHLSPLSTVLVPGICETTP